MGMGRPSTSTVVSAEMLQQAATSSDWLMYGHNYSNNRYSPLTQITTANVKNLVPRLVLQSGVEKLGSFETTPVVVNGIMYVTTPVTPNNIVIAYDLRQGGKTLWRYEHKTLPVSTEGVQFLLTNLSVGNYVVYVRANGTTSGQYSDSDPMAFSVVAAPMTQPEIRLIVSQAYTATPVP